MTTRVNARLEPDLANKLKVLRERTRKTTTEVVKASIEAYFEQVTGSQSRAELLSDFVGCARGPSDLSARYKQRLGESLDRKHRR